MSQPNQQQKKAPGPVNNNSGAAKSPQGQAQKISSTAYSAAESTQKAAQNVVNIGTSAMREILASGTGEAQKAQDKMFEMSREGVENLARSADAFSRILTEMVSIARGNVDALIECASVSSELCREVSSEIAESCNRGFADAVDVSKDAFSCRTLNDVVELQNRCIKQALDSCFNESNKLCGLVFDSATEMMEPINERVAEASEQFSKAFAA